MATVMVQIPVDEETAAALSDPRRLEAVGELIKILAPAQKLGIDRTDLVESFA
jgi:hypothetical protein